MFHFEDTRYNRQEQMPEWGINRQQALANAKVVAIGAGGVKSTLLMSLAAAGVGNLRVIEFDKVELSNLNRQILYTTQDIGRGKAEACKEKLSRLNTDIAIEAIEEKVTSNNIEMLCRDFDFVVEGGESPAGRNLVNEYCLEAGKPFTHASAQFNYGYVFSVVPKLKTACFACFFPEDHSRAEHTGPVPVSVLATSVAGSLGAAEVIKWFTGHQQSMLVNRRVCFSSLLLSGEFTFETQKRRRSCPVCSRFYKTGNQMR